MYAARRAKTHVKDTPLLLFKNVRYSPPIGFDYNFSEGPLFYCTANLSVDVTFCRTSEDASVFTYTKNLDFSQNANNGSFIDSKDTSLCALLFLIEVDRKREICD